MNCLVKPFRCLQFTQLNYCFFFLQNNLNISYSPINYYSLKKLCRFFHQKSLSNCHYCCILLVKKRVTEPTQIWEQVTQGPNYQEFIIIFQKKKMEQEASNNHSSIAILKFRWSYHQFPNATQFCFLKVLFHGFLVGLLGFRIWTLS